MTKRYISIILCIFTFVAMLAFPKAVFNGASEGLLLWFQIIFPTLFPFLLITNLLLLTDSIHYIAQSIAGPLRFLFRVSDNGSFVLLIGFLCGYPMGAKMAADLVISHKITEAEGKYLLSFCNNTSPVFILNFIVWKTLGKEEFALPTFLILLTAPIFVSFVTRRFYLKDQSAFQNIEKRDCKKKKLDFSMLDSCMMNSFETIVKVGGYIILFSVILTLLQEFPWKNPLFDFALPTLEVTNGILLLHRYSLPFIIEYPAILALTSFGGFCSVAQTQCMIQKTGIPLLPYIIEKLAASLAASLLAFIYLLVKNSIL
ncbi:transporter [Faecalicatena acetigenes]|uniref:Transporter n=1 Tax=Faecalicatena acetigenes TaxID=2981790 RepID=A0ABT2T8R0_9FIRM|nr:MULTISPECIES: hypothetical protein [Lachnospiraceae]MCU6746654.1 transporter [Faecalicatena acetigenes]SCH34504.1 Uncharacterized protein conserved in bacteria [uncultured Clostridium sp.]